MRSPLKGLLVSFFTAMASVVSATDTKVVSGIFVFGPESEAFYYCNGEGIFGLLGPDTLMKPIQSLAYELVDRHQQMWVPIFVEAEISDEGKSHEPYYEDYDSIYWVEHLRVVKDTVPADCYTTREFPNREPARVSP